jgi:4-aminobutyrate aminotransferase-like enzyme
VSCAAAVAVTEVFEEEKILDNVDARCDSYSLELIAGAKRHSHSDFQIRRAFQTIERAESRPDCRAAHSRRARKGFDGCS